MADPRKELIVNFVDKILGLTGAANYINNLDDGFIVDWVPKFNFSSFHKDNAFLLALNSVYQNVNDDTRKLAFYSLYNSYIENRNFTLDYIKRPNKIINLPELYKLGNDSQPWSEKIKLISKVIKADTDEKRSGYEWKSFVERIKANQPEYDTSTRNTSRESEEKTIPAKKFLKYVNDINGDSISKEELLRIIKKLL